MPRTKKILTPVEVELKRLQTAERARIRYWTNEKYRARTLERANARMAAGSEARKAATRERKEKDRADRMAAAEAAAAVGGEVGNEAVGGEVGDGAPSAKRLRKNNKIISSPL